MTDDEYTPTTEDVAQAYMNGVWDGGTGETGPRVEATFNRWLAEHDAEVAKEYRDAYEEWRRQGLEMNRVLLDLMRRLRSIDRKEHDNG